MATNENSESVLKPPFRRLRAYAFDPSLSLKMDTADINNMLYTVPWEELEPGPIGEYVEVIDYDPTSGRFYKPVDLNDRYALAQDGYTPSESNPMFHQQMVYAVAMTTIKNFERALGRKILWSPRHLKVQERYEEYVQRLRIYPHAFQMPNAYYSPIKKALLFGYFSSNPADVSLHMPDSLVFTCLSHDIIAHEVTHAILDGLHSFYNEPTNPDVLAFHEAFADIVALFQHFTFPEVLKNQIAKTRGDFASQNLLGELAQEFGTAIGNYGSLRGAIGGIDEKTKKWIQKESSPDEYQTAMEPHARGSILVAAVFEAFINIYKSRISDLMRIATNGTGILPQGELHPDLVNRLSYEASKTAKHVLNMCIRALDYCPPTDITFGDFLRAIITADADLVADDSKDYRLAFIDAFRKRGIYPEGIKTLSVESLALPQVDFGKGDKEKSGMYTSSVKALLKDSQAIDMLQIISDYLREYADEIKYITNRKDIFDKTIEYIIDTNTNQYTERGLHNRISQKFYRAPEFEKITGLAFVDDPEKVGIRPSHFGTPSFQIQNLRLVSRVGPQGNQINYVLFSILQRSGVVIKDGVIDRHYKPNGFGDDVAQNPIPEGGFEFRGGCTLIFDLDNQKLKYVITKPLLDTDYREDYTPRINKDRVLRQYRYQMAEKATGVNEFAGYFSNSFGDVVETFSFLHQH